MSAHTATPPQRTLRHPLENITDGGWAKGLLRIVAAALILILVLHFTGEETWAILMKLDHLPWFVGGAFLLALQRVLRVRKWALIVERADLPGRPWTWLVRVQFIGLLINLLVPASEALKVWAVSDDKTHMPRAARTILLDTGMLSVSVGATGLLAGLALPSGALGSMTWIIVALTALALGIVALLMRGIKPPAMAWIISLAEALCVLAVFGIALAAIDAPASPLFLAAAFPLLYLSHLFMLTPSGLGLREALFAAVFGALSATPTEAAVAMGLFISAMQLSIAIGGGGIAMLWPGKALGPRQDAQK